MSAQPSSFTPAPPHVFVTNGETRKTKQQHQQLQHVINRMTARMGFPDKAARCVTGLHGLLNGREPHSFPALIPHKYAAAQLNYTGKEENSDVFMGRYLDALKDAEIKAGRKCFEIERANGVTTIVTTYHADYIGEAALWALAEARATEEWKKHPAKAVTDELIDRAIAKLPVRTPPEARDTADGPSVTDGALIKGLWTKVDTLTEAAMRKVAEGGGDPLAALEEVQRRHRRIAAEVRREQLERDQEAKDAEYYKTLDWLADTAARTDGKNISDDSEKFSTGDDTSSDADHPTDCRMDFAKSQQKRPVFPEVVENVDSLHTTCAKASTGEGLADWLREIVAPPPPSEALPPSVEDSEGASDVEEEVETGESPKLLAALASIAEGIAVLALWGVADGICDCPKGSECPSPGKHPYPRFSPNGVHSATLDAAKVRMWYAKDPRINFGQAMGGERNIVCVDIDPRNGGSESYFDLIQHYGDEAFTATREKTTGGGGWHKLYRLSKSITGTGELKAKLAPGIDVKGAGGLIVAPLGDHVSGTPYGPDNGVEIAIAPAWMEELIIKASEGGRAPEPIRFQAEKGRPSATNGKRYFSDGERNNGLRDVMRGRWGHADEYGIRDAQDLYQQMLEIRDTRCAAGEDMGATDAKLWEMVQRTVRKFARGNRRVAAA